MKAAQTVRREGNGLLSMQRHIPYLHYRLRRWSRSCCLSQCRANGRATPPIPTTIKAKAMYGAMIQPPCCVTSISQYCCQCRSVRHLPRFLKKALTNSMIVKGTPMHRKASAIACFGVVRCPFDGNGCIPIRVIQAAHQRRARPHSALSLVFSIRPIAS